MTQYVTLSADTTTIVSWFAGPQPGNTNVVAIQDTDARYVAYQTAQAAIQAVGTALKSGVQVNSTSTPSLNAVYGVDPVSQAKIQAVSTGIAARGRVPGGGTTFNYPDITGQSHAFSAANFLNFATAIEDYIYNLTMGLAQTTPLTIA